MTPTSDVASVVKRDLDQAGLTAADLRVALQRGDLAGLDQALRQFDGANATGANNADCA